MSTAAISEQLVLAGIADGIGWELTTIQDDRAANRCTAASLDARTELRASIMEVLTENVLGTRLIAQRFGVSREVVRALRRSAVQNGELDHVKQGLARAAYALADATIDRINDELDEMPKSSLPIIAGVMIDKAQLLSGGPTSITEQKRGESVADFDAYLRNLPVAQPVVEGVSTAQKAPLLLEEDAIPGAPADLGGLRIRNHSGDILSPALRDTTEEDRS